MRIIKYLGVFCIIAVFIFLFTVSFHSDSAINQDLGRHLKIGEIILSTKSVPKTNLFSYTYSDFPFINHHWGSEAIFYLVHNISGINGLIVAKTLVIFLAFFLLVVYSFRKTNGIIAAFSSILAIEVTRGRLEIRPEIFALLFFSIFLLVIYLKRNDKKDYLFLLPFIMLFWVNTHISFVYGLALYFFFILDRFIMKKISKKFLVLGSLFLVISILNPFFIKGALYPFRIFENYGYSIAENQTVFFLEKMIPSNRYLYLKISVFFIMIISPILFLKKKYFELFTIYSFSILSFMMVRNMPFFSLTLIYPLSVGLKEYFEIAKKRFFINERKKLLIVGKGILAALILFFVISEVKGVLSGQYYEKKGKPIRFGLGQSENMKGTIDYFEESSLKGPIFNNFDIGSYILYRLYPEERVFVDGRPEAYPASFFQKTYIPMQQDVNLWKEKSQMYGFDVIIFSHTDMTPWGRKFMSNILKDKDWSLSYFDDFGMLLVRKDIVSDETMILDSKKEFESHALKSIENAKTIDELYRLSGFFKLVGDEKLWKTTLLKAQRIIDEK